ncbi:MAG TPA: recombinase family protein [Terracidiphilus sp.]|jgi:DNA invertase Pin-like site-specific DNA recombinase
MNIDTHAADRAKRAAFYLRVTPFDPDPELQLVELRRMAAERGYEVVAEFAEKVSATKAKRPALDRLLTDARRGHFDLVIIWSCDRIARSTRHFLDLLDELHRLHIEFSSVRDGIDTSGPQGDAITLLTSVLAGLERSLTSERVRAGMRRARLDGQHIGRAPLQLDAAAIHRDRQQGHSLQQIAKDHRISTATVQRVLKKNLAGPLDEAV